MVSDVPGESRPFADACGVCGVLQDLAGKDEALYGQRQRLYRLDSRVSATENDSSLIDLVAGESNLMEDLELVVRADFIDRDVGSA